MMPPEAAVAFGSCWEIGLAAVVLQAAFWLAVNRVIAIIRVRGVR